MSPSLRRLEILTNLGSRVDHDELLDRGYFDPVELEGNLRDIRTVNRLAGGQDVVLAHLPGLMARVDRERPVEVLDLATGSGDIPSAVAAWAARHARPLRLTVSDVSAEILAAAQRELVRVADVTFSLWDAREVPRPDQSFDIVLCSLALHHFGPPDAIRVLREMQRLARTGFIVNDIRRSVPGFVAAWAASRLATHNRLTRHDMPLSVRRAYTPGELRALLQGAGVAGARVTTHPLFRMAAVYHRHDR
jgi:ubiquinone/menaquinone biosynthesis C-methylase UbiE